MKKIFICLVVLILLLTSGAAFASDPIKIFINGIEIKTDVAPVNENGRIMVPVRFVSEELGQSVYWDDGSQKVIVVSPQKKFKAYHDREDFLNDLNTALECLSEADNNLSEAFQEDDITSNTHINRALYWIQAAQNYENNLAQYRDEAKMQDEYKKLTEIRTSYQSVTNELKKIGFPRTEYNMNDFLPPDIKRGEIYFKLDDFKKTLGR